MLPHLPALVYGALAVFAAGYIRGFSGFGFSMFAVISLSLYFPPAVIVPPVLMWEVAASAWLLPRVFRDVQWRSLAWLSLGVVFGMPFGVHLLATVPPAPMKAGIGLVVIALSVLLLRGFRLENTPGPAATVGTGVLSGLLNGAAAIGGPPVIIFYLSTPQAVAAGRATMIAYFLGTDVYAAILAGFYGLVTWQTAIMAVTLLVPLIAGVTLGSRRFGRTSDEKFRRVVLSLLLVLSAAALVKAILE